MKKALPVYFFITAAFFQSLFPQARIKYNDQDLFLSGANLAWVSFANDVGTGQPNLESFASTFLAVHDSGGNSMRLWLHTNGSASPEFNSPGFVIGPGENTIQDLKQIMDLAWEREIGLKLCLWSFDMLRASNNPASLARNKLMLEDTSYTMSYINNALIPMVDSLKGHPAILAWEIFNEPEGMSNEYGWSGIQHTSMANIQRFINLCAGAIHRTDTAALVTSGAWSFTALTDVSAKVVSAGADLNQLSLSEMQEIEETFRLKYNLELSAEEIINHIKKVSVANYNYYSNGRLIGAGGDPDGILDFYSVHYYSALGVNFSPFTHNASFWHLDKPIVVAEFAMQESHGGISKQRMFEQLLLTGYAGALAWSWTDITISSRQNMLSAMKYMWDNHKTDVDVNGISGQWPSVSIVSPINNAVFPDNAEITITANANDIDGTVTLVEFFASDTIKIGEKNSSPYTLTWTNIPAGEYLLTAVATDDTGNKRESAGIRIKVGTPAFTKLEAEAAAKEGSNIAVKSDPGVSNGAYVEMRTNVGSITWSIPNVTTAGAYEIRFGYRLSFDRPKTQFLNVNGSYVMDLVFDTTTNSWYEKSVVVNLAQGRNTIQMQLSWGWMDIDYLSVPTQIITAVDDEPFTINEYRLEQNYPNPFNPETNFEFQIANFEFVSLRVFDILGNEVAVLVNEERPSGKYSINFDASNLSSGVYFYTLKAGKFQSTKKMILLK